MYHCRKILQMSEGLSQEQADEKVKRAVESGSALEKLKEIVSAQGGDERAVDDFSLLPLAPNRLLSLIHIWQRSYFHGRRRLYLLDGFYRA